jgi:hypothetical protein
VPFRCEAALDCKGAVTWNRLIAENHNTDIIFVECMLDACQSAVPYVMLDVFFKRNCNTRGRKGVFKASGSLNLVPQRSSPTSKVGTSEFSLFTLSNNLVQDILVN